MFWEWIYEEIVEMFDGVVDTNKIWRLNMIREVTLPLRFLSYKLRYWKLLGGLILLFSVN